MLKSVLNRGVVALTAGCAIVGAPLVPAYAAPSVGLAASSMSTPHSPTASSDADEVVDILASISTKIPDLQDVDPASATIPLAPGSSSGESTLLRRATEASVSAAGENPLTVTLQAAEDAVAVSVSETGIEVIDNGDGSHTVPLNRSDGSLQVVTVIDSSTAPRRYSVDVGLPEDVTLTATEEGALVAMAPDGTLALGVAPAWAYDAVGVAVPTRYTVEGSTITQIVEHDSSEHQYPITADPWLGQRLFSPMTVNRKGAFQGRPVYSGRLTPWGVAMGLGNAGFTIMSTAGWEEFASSWSAVRNSRSMYQQYQCHALWGRAIIGAGIHWDLEAVRPANANWANVFSHQCNW